MVGRVLGSLVSVATIAWKPGFRPRRLSYMALISFLIFSGAAEDSRVRETPSNADWMPVIWVCTSHGERQSRYLLLPDRDRISS